MTYARPAWAWNPHLLPPGGATLRERFRLLQRRVSIAVRGKRQYPGLHRESLLLQATGERLHVQRRVLLSELRENGRERANLQLRALAGAEVDASSRPTEGVGWISIRGALDVADAWGWSIDCEQARAVLDRELGLLYGLTRRSRSKGSARPRRRD